MSYDTLLDQLTPADLKLANIYLDPNNPRFTGSAWHYISDDQIALDSIQEATRLRLIKEFGVGRLRMNMEVNGFLPIDRVVVREFATDQYVVLEGNRRICAAKLITPLTPDGEQVPARVLSSIDTIPCLVYTVVDRDVSWIIQGLRHITGLADWSSFNKAQLLVEQMEAENLTQTEIGKRFGLTAHGAGQWLRGYFAFQQAKERSDYVREVDEQIYPYLQELFSRSSIRVREWMKWDDSDHEFKDELRFNEFVGWFYPRPEAESDQAESEALGDWEQRVITRQDDIRQLAYLLSTDPEAFEHFRRDLNLEAAYASALVKEQSARGTHDPVEEVFTSIRLCARALDNLPFKLLRENSGRENLTTALEPLERAISAIKKRCEVRSKKAQFLDWLDRQPFESLILDFEGILVSGTEATLKCDRVAAENFTAGNLNRYWSYLLQKIDVDQSRGITALLQVADDIAYRLRWAPVNMMRSGGRRDRRVGALLGSRPQLLRRIDGLSRREYEALGCVACKLVGASRTHLTPPGDEGGIDFLALVPLPAPCHLFGPRRGPLRIVGQSKRYESPVSVGAVRDFITTIENVRKRQPSVEPHVPAWFRAARGPLLGFICGHRGFQSGAESIAQDHGIITADSLDLAEAACLSRHLPEAATVTERAGILVKMVQEVLSPSGAS